MHKPLLPGQTLVIYTLPALVLVVAGLVTLSLLVLTLSVLAGVHTGDNDAASQSFRCPAMCSPALGHTGKSRRGRALGPRSRLE